MGQHKPIPDPPPDFNGTMAEWKALKPSAQYYQFNLVKIKAFQKLWKQKNYIKEAARKKLYGQKNKEKISDAKRLYRQQNKEKVNDGKKQWSQRNPDKVVAYSRKSYIKKERDFYTMFGSQGII